MEKQFVTKTTFIRPILKSVTYTRNNIVVRIPWLDWKILQNVHVLVNTVFDVIWLATTTSDTHSSRKYSKWVNFSKFCKWINNLKKYCFTDYLPLVLIQHKGELYYPNRIAESNIDKNLGFIGNTQFFKDKWKDQMFFCPADSTDQINQINKANKLMLGSARLRSWYSKTNVSNNCLFKQNITKDKALQCAKEAIPSIHEVLVGKFGEQQVRYCGPGNQSTLYKFAYEVSVAFIWLNSSIPRI